jgi:hypothetical protein
MFIKHLSEKNTMVLENIMILSQNFKNTLFPNTPLTVFLLPTSTVPLTATANGREKKLLVFIMGSSRRMLLLILNLHFDHVDLQERRGGFIM